MFRNPGFSGRTCRGSRLISYDTAKQYVRTLKPQAILLGLPHGPHGLSLEIPSQDLRHEERGFALQNTRK